jgi:hypothetical protein
MKSLKHFLPESFLREFEEEPHDSISPVNGEQGSEQPDPKKIGIDENAETLNIGDPVIIVGKGIEFEGKTGDIYDFGQDKRFVIVNLYNHGKHSFHSSDVEYNDYDGDEENSEFNDDTAEDDRELANLRRLSGY